MDVHRQGHRPIRQVNNHCGHIVLNSLHGNIDLLLSIYFLVQIGINLTVDEKLVV